MAFALGSFVDGLFSGAKSVNELLEARNKMAINAQLWQANELYQSRQDDIGDLEELHTATYDPEGVDKAKAPVPTTGTTAPPPPTGEAEAPDLPARGLGSRSGGWGLLAPVAIKALQGVGQSPAAIQGIMANGLGEGGFVDPWVKSSIRNEQSFGHWQFNAGGELPGYMQWVAGKGDAQDTKLQAEYVAHRMEQLYPGFSTITDPKLATDLVATKFERYQGARFGQRYGYLADVQRAMTGGSLEPRNDVSQVPTYGTNLTPSQAPSQGAAPDALAQVPTYGSSALGGAPAAPLAPLAPAAPAAATTGVLGAGAMGNPDSALNRGLRTAGSAVTGALGLGGASEPIVATPGAPGYGRLTPPGAPPMPPFDSPAGQAFRAAAPAPSTQNSFVTVAPTRTARPTPTKTKGGYVDGVYYNNIDEWNRAMDKRATDSFPTLNTPAQSRSALF